MSWTAALSGFGDSNIQVAHYGGGVWVIGGQSGKLATASSPAGPWTINSSAATAFGSSTIFGVVYNESNQWVAVGGNGTLATASDPTGTWTVQTSSFGTTNIRDVTWGNGFYCAVGLAGKLATSTNGTAWTQQTSSFGANDIFAVGYGNSEFCATGANNTIGSTGNDPTTGWTQRTAPAWTAGGTIGAVTYGSTQWVIMNAFGELATATTASGTWTYNSQPTFFAVGRTGFGASYMSGISKWVAISGLSFTWSAVVGTATTASSTWTQQVDHPFKLNTFRTVANDGTYFVIAGDNGMLAYASNPDDAAYTNSARHLGFAGSGMRW